jgi:hypothetical protein
LEKQEADAGLRGDHRFHVDADFNKTTCHLGQNTGSGTGTIGVDFQDAHIGIMGYALNPF